MPHRLKLFIDDGGVMNDNARRAPQFARLVGKYMPPRLGGSPEAWAAANTEVATGLFERHFAHFYCTSVRELARLLGRLRVRLARWHVH